MTDAARLSTDNGWRTAGGQVWPEAVLTISTILISRFAVGANFGFVLYLLVWLPVLSAWATTRDHRRQRLLIGGAAIVSTMLSLLSAWPSVVALNLTALLILFSAMTSVMMRVISRFAGRVLAISIVTIAWLTWLAVPLLMAGLVRSIVGESGFSRLLAVHPVLVCNAVDATAGDWTHRTIAYSHLTRLGQDISFDWPNSAWLAVAWHGILTIAALLFLRIVPRGTNENG